MSKKQRVSDFDLKKKKVRRKLRTRKGNRKKTQRKKAREEKRKEKKKKEGKERKILISVFFLEILSVNPTHVADDEINLFAPFHFGLHCFH